MTREQAWHDFISTYEVPEDMDRDEVIADIEDGGECAIIESFDPSLPIRQQV